VGDFHPAFFVTCTFWEERRTTRTELERFSRDEAEFLKQATIFDWKERITQKIKRVLEHLHEELARRITAEELLTPPGMDFAKWQVVRGERFHNQPYVYLDFPQFFTRQTKFTYRSMFWWGSGFAFALILEGDALDHYRERLIFSYDALADHGLVISLADTPWDWRPNSPHNLPIQRINRQVVIQALATRTFLKLQSFLDFDEIVQEEGIVIRRAVETFDLLRAVVRRVD